MIFVHRLCLLHPAVKAGGEVLREPDEGLDEQQPISHHPKPSMRGGEVRGGVAELIHFYHHERCDECTDCRDVEAEVGERAGVLLRGGVRGLEEEDGLG